MSLTWAVETSLDVDDVGAGLRATLVQNAPGSGPDADPAPGESLALLAHELAGVGLQRRRLLRPSGVPMGYQS